MAVRSSRSIGWVALALLVFPAGAPLASGQASVLSVVPTLSTGATVHPRLLFSAADVPALRARVATEEVPRAAFSRIKEKAEAYLLRVRPEVVRANVGVDYELQGLQKPYTLQNEMPTYLIELGMAYQLSGDARYGRHAVELMLALADAKFPFWTGGTDLGIGDLGEGVGLGFDWTYELMTPAERNQIVGGITAAQDSLFVRSMFEYHNEASTYKTSNWQGVLGGGTGLLLLAIRGEPDAPSGFTSPPNAAIPPFVPAFPARHYDFDDYLDKALEKAGNYLRFGYDSKGAGHEGHTYAHYGLKNSVPFALAARREGLGDLLGPTGARNAARWLAFEQLPGVPQNFVPLNDSQRNQFGVDLQALLFGIDPNNGVNQWLWRRTVGKLGNDFYNEPYTPAIVGDDGCVLDRVLEAPVASGGCNIFHSHGNVWAVLFYRTPTETPEVEPSTTAPLSVHYNELGLVDARTGFTRGKHEVVSTFQARRQGGTHHFQYDHGNFTLYGEGGNFAVDPGTSCVSCGDTNEAGYAVMHNVVLVDDQKETQSFNSRYFNGTTIDDFLTAPNLSLTHADLRYTYSADPSVSFDPPFAGRDHLFSRVPGRPVVIGILDELERDAVPRNHAYTWQMLTDETNLVVTDGSGFTVRSPNGATLVGRGAVDATAASDPAFGVRMVQESNVNDDYGVVQKLYSTTTSRQRFEQVTVMALTPASKPAASTAILRLGGANAVAVDWQGTREIVLRRSRNAAMVTGEVETDGRVADLIVGQGETVLRAGTRLSAYGVDYVRVTGSEARVAVSGDRIQADGAAGNGYRVFAPGAIQRVTVNGAAVSSCREGDYVVFPCVAAPQLTLSKPATARPADATTLPTTLTLVDGSLPVSRSSLERQRSSTRSR